MTYFHLPEENKTLDNIYKLASKIDYLGQEMHERQQDLQQFLTEYYGNIGSLLSRLETLRSELSHTTSFTASAPEGEGVFANMPVCTDSSAEEVPGLPIAEKHPLEQDMKSLYMLLVRRFHPDSGVSGNSECMKRINRTYADRHYGGMWLVMFEQEWQEIQHLPVARRWKALTHYEEELMGIEAALQASLTYLTDSPEHQLMQRAYTARLRGVDLLRDVSEHIEEEIALLSRRVHYHSMRKRLMEEAG